MNADDAILERAERASLYKDTRPVSERRNMGDVMQASREYLRLKHLHSIYSPGCKVFGRPNLNVLSPQFWALLVSVSDTVVEGEHSGEAAGD